MTTITNKVGTIPLEHENIQNRWMECMVVMPKSEYLDGSDILKEDVEAGLQTMKPESFW